VTDITVTGRGVYLKTAATLVIADTHIGRDESSAVSLPLGAATDMRERLDRLLARFDPETVVIAGDVVHTFGRVSDHSRETLEALETTCADAGAELVLVAGNHDVGLANAWDGPLHDAYVLADDGTSSHTVVCHGHELPTTTADSYLIGHVHPTIVLEGARHPCVLHGRACFRGADVVCLPAFTRLASGIVVNDLTAEAFGSPLVTDADALEPIVFDDDAGESLRFPPLGDLRPLL
jgi:putative SbcD/Mre11-related phosphoesterase